MRIDMEADVVTQGRRKLREMFATGPMASTSVTTVAAAPIAREVDEEKNLQARARRESGPVKRTFDPASFDWVIPGAARLADRLTLRVYSKGLYIVAPETEAWLKDWVDCLVMVGFAARAIAVRRTTGRGFRVRLNESTMHHIGLTIQSKVVHDRAVKQGFPVGTVLEAHFDREHDMIVGIKGKEG